MARKRRTHRRRATKRRSPVTSLRRHSVYLTNPRRRRVRRRHAVGVRRHRRRSHNPPIMGQVIQLGKDTLATLGGGAAAKLVGGFLPAIGGVPGAVAIGTALAIGLRMVSARFLGADMARFVGAGAMQPVLKGLISSISPQAGAFLGDYYPYGMMSYPEQQVSGYLAEGAEPQVEIGEEPAGVGSYGY